MILKKCRVCNSRKLKKILSLGHQPLANNLGINKVKLKTYPLELNLCKKCYNCQLSVNVSSNKLFNKYLYKSSISRKFINHFAIAAKKYKKLFNLKKKSYILDIGSNDGIGLLSFKKEKFENLYGIEPAINLSKITRKMGIKTFNCFLNRQLSNKLKNKFDLITASNVYAHVPNINEFTYCVKNMLKQDGVFIVEVQYLYRMIKDLSFDNIYHEHVNYWSIKSLFNFLYKNNLLIFNVEEIDTHGGSIRVYIKKKNNLNLKISHNVKLLLKKEIKFGLNNVKKFENFKKKVFIKKKNIHKKLKEISKNNKNIVGYGAPAKATTLIHFYKISKYIRYIIDDNILKKNKYIPNTKIKIYNKHKKQKIDYMIVFAWNYFKEIKMKNKNNAKKFLNIFRY